MDQEHFSDSGSDLPLPTHIPEIASRILLFLDYVYIMYARGTNRDFNRVYCDDYFWKLKVELDYGMVTQYKPSNLTYRDQYIGLDRFKDPNEAACESRWDVLESLSQQNIYPSSLGIIIAITKGRPEILEWLSEHNIHLNQRDAGIAASNNKLEVLQLFAQYNVYPDQRGVNAAAGRGHLKILQWSAQHNIFPDQEGINRAAANGRLEVLEWSARTRNFYPDQRGATDAIMNNHQIVFGWLAQHNIDVDQQGVN
jgi:hypothetical protein